MGDDIQAMKAGLLEIGDVFIVNKSDHPGAEDVVEQLQAMLDLSRRPATAWRPPVLKTVAVKNEGIVELVDTCWRHRQFLIDSGAFGQHNFKWEYQFFRQLVMEMAADRIFEGAQDSPSFQALLDDLRDRRIDPISAAERMLQMYQNP
jgi:LAO/AO transport system kinase